jgi:hypothetical protein
MLATQLQQQPRLPQQLNLVVKGRLGRVKCRALQTALLYVALGFDCLPNPNSTAECNNLTMNSATALMASHNIVCRIRFFKVQICIGV